ncbi:Adenine-specific DNA methylase, N12 class [Actinacidiphila alni]|uniref:Adenine-specific DNA methylase, N12 class n=1 Tax=Actinacidiphila alni TaxID=380248 RepID=A0A1I2L8K5_9ACTN|nr:UvrD-helicase domain-containing protein [Actinacidiphila alni]SFF74820.1 Adenine-specific DNA methylase, N12 class [Actinacidiphila alni]
MYQTPRHLSDLESQAASGTIAFRASTSPDAGPWQYRLYTVDIDSPDADPAEAGKFLLLRVSDNGGVHEVASPRVLAHQSWAEDAFDALWEAQERGELPAADGEPSPETITAEQDIVSRITSRPAVPPASSVSTPTPSALTPDDEDSAPAVDRPQHLEDLNDGDLVWHLGDSPHHGPDPEELVEAVVITVTGTDTAEILVQDPDADDEPYPITFDMVVERQRPHRPQPGEAVRYRPHGQTNLPPSGPLGRIRANIAAIRTLHVLRGEQRPATADEQAVLARWSSWGAVPQIFDPRKRDLAGLRAELRSLLTETEWHAAEATTRNAHFTDPDLVQPVWQALQDLGFTDGRVLEPGSGSGNFLALAPDAAQMTGVELDPTTAEISAALYPDATIRAESFVDTRLPEGYFDAALGNVPFDEIALHDPVHNPLRLATHNHFIVKSLELVRPGGLVALLTSRYTLDAMGKTARLEIADRAELVGAVRLPAGAHRRVAGTDAVTDLVILRRREGAMPATPPEWVGLASVQISPDTNVLVNSYFAKHPDRILGSLGVTSSQFTDQDITVRRRPGSDLATELSDVLTTITRQAREEGLTMSASPDAVQRAAVDQRAERMRQAQEMFGQDLQRYEGTILDQHNGTFLQVVGGELAERPVFRNATQELSSLLRLRDTYIDLLSAESSGDTDQATTLRQKLNQFYGAHTGQYGFLNARDSRRDRRSAHGAFRSDPFAAGVYALEIYDTDTQTARRSAIFTRPVTPPQTAQTTADTPQDALAISLNTYGEVRLSEIARLLDVDSLDEARDALGDMVFNEPGSQRLIPAAEYLSGNVRAKIEAAEKILAFVSPEGRDTHPFQANIAALRGVLPPDKQPGDIDVIQIGVTWVAPKYYEAFLQQLLQSRYVTVTRTSGADWEVDAPSSVRTGRAATKVYGTTKRNAVDLAQRLLRRASLVVHPPKLDEDASQQDIQNGKRWAAEQTEQTVAKADELNRLFADWLWQDPDRTTAVLHDYNRLFNSFVPYQGDGAHLTFPGLSDAITPRPHQRAGVARVLAEPHGSFLDYEVGFGKTLTIAMSLMEMKRLGMVRKPCIVVKNPTVNDFRNDFLKAYPGARVLAIDSSEFTKETAASYVAQIANGDWDAIILPQSLFKRIPLSGRGQQQFVADQTAEYRARVHKILTGSDDAQSAAMNPGGDPLIADALEVTAAVSTVAARSSKAPDRETVKKLQGDLKRHTQRAEKNLVKQTTRGISWEQTGIDFIAVDEVQDFANGEVGANNSELALPVSTQSKDLKIKLRTMEKAFGPKVGLGSTGTPFPNAMPQAYVMLDFFRPDLLAASEISAFSSFQAQYLTEVVAPEISPEGVPRIKERIGAFRNSLQFSQTWRTMADVKTKRDINMPVPKSVGETVVVPATGEDRAFMEEIAWRADLVRGGRVDASEDNLLKISNDGRMAAMDLRMIDRDPDGPGKLDAAAEKIAAIYHEFKDRAYTDRDGNPTDLPGALQLVFADRGTPSDSNRKLGKFVAYEYLRDELFLRGIPVDQVRFAQDAKTAEEKATLFADARLGKVAVLIGSTETMGVGVNVQDRAIALHHIDCPWRPSDVTQREGRIVRQYNQHYELDIPVRIYRWVKAGSFDSFMWQTVERKARFIDQVRTGRELDEQDAALDGDLGKDYLEFGEIKAIATGNPLLLKKLAADEQVRTLEAAYSNWKRTEDHLQHVVATADETLSAAQRQADSVGRALGASTETKADAFRLVLPDGTVVTKRQDAAAALRTKLALIHRRMGLRDGVSGWEQVGTLGGQPFQVRINTTHDFAHFSITGLNDISQAGFTIDDVDALLNEDRTPLGLVTRMENQVERLDGLHTLLLGTVDQLAQEIDRARSLVGSPFAKMDKLTRARAEQMQLDAEISGQAGAHHADEPGTEPPSKAREMSAADMAIHDAQVRAAEFGGTAIVIQGGQWYGTTTGVPPDAAGEDGTSVPLPSGRRPVVMLPDEELPDFTTIPGEVAEPQALAAKFEAAQTAFREWAQLEIVQEYLNDTGEGDFGPFDEDPEPNGPRTNAINALHDAYLHALRYRGEDQNEWTRRYGNVVAQSRNLADRYDEQETPESEKLDILAVRLLGNSVQDFVASALASWAAHQLETPAAAPMTAAEVDARPDKAPLLAVADLSAGAEPYEDRADYWVGEHAALTAYVLFASGSGARLADGIDQEQALVQTAEAMIAESVQARQSRLLGLDHVVPWELADTFARRARVVAEQWDRERRATGQVSDAMAMAAAIRDHAARYRATIEDPAGEAFQQWFRSDEPIDLLDEEAEEFIAGLSMTTAYTVTGPAGVRSVPRSGIDLAAGIAQLIADGTVIEETDRGWTLSTPEGNRFDIAPASPAPAVEGSATPPSRKNTPETAAETETAPGEETPQGGSVNPRARNLAVFLGGYSAPGDLVVARQFIAESLAQVEAAAQARTGSASPVANLVDEVVRAGAAATGTQQVQPADAFGQYEQLAEAATRLADSSTGRLAQQAVRLAQRTERHLGRMHAAGRDLFDLLLDAAALDPDSFEVIRRNDPLKERPTPYASSAELSFARGIVNRTYDQWPALYTSEGAEASDKLRAAMWQIREAPDADSGTALTDWLNIASYALGASEEAEQGVSRSVLRDVAQRAYQHYQGLAAHQLAAANTPPYGPDRSAAEGAARLADAWKDWTETATARDLVERANRPSTDTSLPAERAAHEEIRQAHYAAEWARLADGTLDDAARRTAKLAHTTYALVLNMREGGYQQSDDERILSRLVKLAHEHAAGIRAAAAEPDTALVVHAELAARQEQLRSHAPSEGGAPAVLTHGAVTPSGTLEIEHHYRGSVVRGAAAGPENRDVRTALARTGFKESKEKEFWYLPRRMVKANRDTHVRNLVEELQQLGRRYEMLHEPAPAGDHADDDIVIPTGAAYTSLAEAEADVSALYGAYFESRETAAGKRMIGRGTGARPDGEAVHVALEALRQGPVGSALSPFRLAAEDVVERSATLARALTVLGRHLEEERFRAPVALRHLRALTQYATLLASRTAATAQAGAWDVLVAPDPEGTTDPAAPQQDATTDILAHDATAEPATAQAPTIHDADALLAGPYTGDQMLEVIERLDELRRRVTDALPPIPQPDGIPGPPSAGPEEWFRGPARVEVPDGFVPYVNELADLKPGDVVRIGFKRRLESRRPSYRTLMVTGPRDWGDGYYRAAPDTRMHPREIVAVPPDSRLLTGTDDDRYTLRYHFTEWWEQARQAGRAAVEGEQPLTAALDLYRQALIASGALERSMQTAAPPEAARALAARLLAETEHHMVRLSLTERIAVETAADAERRRIENEAAAGHMADAPLAVADTDVTQAEPHDVGPERRTPPPADESVRLGSHGDDRQLSLLTQEALDVLPKHAGQRREQSARLALVTTLRLRDAEVRGVLLLLTHIETDDFGEDPIVHGAQITPRGSRLASSLDARFLPADLLAMDTQVLPLSSPISWATVEQLTALEPRAARSALSVDALLATGRDSGADGTAVPEGAADPASQTPAPRAGSGAESAEEVITPGGPAAVVGSDDKDPVPVRTTEATRVGSRSSDLTGPDGSSPPAHVAAEALKRTNDERLEQAASPESVALDSGDGVEKYSRLDADDREDDTTGPAPERPADDGAASESTSRSFTTTGQLRTHFKAAPMRHLSTTSRREVGRLADRPGFALVGNGNFALVPEGGSWSLLAAGSAGDMGRVDHYTYLTGQGFDTALVPMAGFSSPEEAAAFAERLAAVRDDDGRPVPWDDPRPPGAWDVHHRELDRLVLAARAAFDTEAGLSRSHAQLVWHLIARRQRDRAPDGQVYVDDLGPGNRVWFEADDAYWIREVVDVGENASSGLITLVLAEVGDDDTADPESGDEWDVPRNLLLKAAPPAGSADPATAGQAVPVVEEHQDQAVEPEVHGGEAAGVPPEDQNAAHGAEEQDSAPADRPEENEDTDEPSPPAVEGTWSSRIRIVTDEEGTFVTGTGGDYFRQEGELRQLLKRKGRNFGFRDGRWRYLGKFANRDGAVEEIRAYLRAKDAEEAAATAAEAAKAVEYPPTPQQQAIIDAVLAGQDVAVQALAGTGKTSTMLMLAKRLPDKRIAYIAFNRSIADEGKRKFPRHVIADTSHGFARRVMVHTPFKDKIGRVGRNGGAWHKPEDVAKALAITKPLRYRGGKIDPDDVARIVKDAVVRYRESADKEPGTQHLGGKWASTPAAGPLLEVVARAWSDIADPDSDNLLFAHDDYLKLWALTEPRLDYDLIVFDEAQDINPVLQKVIQDQPVQTVVVGDSHQAIYEFRGAIDALKDWPADQVLPLTKSWRFGPEVAALGNAFLDLLGSDLTLEGNTALNTTIGSVEDPDAVLSRTNVGAIGAVVAGFEAGKRVALVGGGTQILDVAKAAKDLQRGRKTKNPELASFASWHEVREHAENERDKSLQVFVRLVDKYTADGLIDMIGNLVPEDARGEQNRPQLIVSTAHKAKGREWDTVRIADDFTEPEENEEGELVLDPGELRLAYVTVTRAKTRLEIGSLSWIRTLGTNTGPEVGGAAAVAGPQQVAAAEQQEPTSLPAPRLTDDPAALDAPRQVSSEPAKVPERLAGAPYVTVGLSEGPDGQLVISATMEGGGGLGRSAGGITAAEFAGQAGPLPLSQVVPAPVRRPGAQEQLISSDEIMAWLGEHLPNGPLATPWAIPAVQRSLIDTLLTAVRDDTAPPAEEIVDWLVEAAKGVEGLALVAQVNDEDNFTIVFDQAADDIMDGAPEPALWRYYRGPFRREIIGAAAPRAYLALRAADPETTGPDAVYGGETRPPVVTSEAPASEREGSRQILLFDDSVSGEQVERPTGAGGSSRTTAAPARRDQVDDREEPLGAGGSASPTPDAEAGSPDPGPGLKTAAPLPWSVEKIEKRSDAAMRRNEKSDIPSLYRNLVETHGHKAARIWVDDNPWAQFRLNLQFTLDGLPDAERDFVSQAAERIEEGIGRIADREASRYVRLVKDADGDRSRLSALREELKQTDTQWGFADSPLREGVTFVMESIDNAERAARKRKLKAATVRNALDQIVGLGGAVLKDGDKIPIMGDALSPIKAQPRFALEALQAAGLDPSAAEETARIRLLLGRSVEDAGRPATQTSTAAEELPAVKAPEARDGSLTDDDIAAAILRIDERQFGLLILDTGSERPKRPELLHADVPLPDGATGTAERGQLTADQSGLELTVSADGAVVRAGKLNWAQVSAWLRPALTDRRADLTSLLWRTGNRLRSNETGFRVIGEAHLFAAAQVELDEHARRVQERVVADALGAHRSGLAAVLAAHTQRGAVAADGALISFSDVISGLDATDDDAEVVLERIRQLRAVMPDAHVIVRRVSEVQAGDAFASVSERRLPFLARDAVADADGQLAISGVLIEPAGPTTDYTWTNEWWTMDTHLEAIPLPDSLAALVPESVGPDEPVAPQQPILDQAAREPDDTRAKDTEAPDSAVPHPAVDDAAVPVSQVSVPALQPVEEPGSGVGAVMLTELAPPVTSTGSQRSEQPPAKPADAAAARFTAPSSPEGRAAGYRDLAELLHEVAELDRLHARWDASPTGRLLLADAEELRRETGAVDSTEAARIDIAMAAVLAVLDSARARQGLLLGAVRQLAAVIAEEGKLLGERAAFASVTDREVLLDVYVGARDLTRRLEATDELQRLLDSTGGGGWLLTRYRKAAAPSDDVGQPPTVPSDAVSAPGAHAPVPFSRPDLTRPVSPAQPELPGAGPDLPEKSPGRGRQPAPAPANGLFDDFDFWRDVIGDDLVVGGVVYDSAVYEPDDDGGVRRREQRDTPAAGTPADEEREDNTTEESMAESTATLAPDSGASADGHDSDLDRAFEDVINTIKGTAAKIGRASTPPALSPESEEHLRAGYAELRTALSAILRGIDAEPVVDESADPAVDMHDATELESAIGTARAESGYYWGTPEWTAIRSITRAAGAFRASVRTAALAYVDQTVADIRFMGLDRTIQARTARAVSYIAHSLARRLEKSGQRDTRGWRAAWGLHRAAATRADRLTGILPAGHDIGGVQGLRRAWRWLAEQLTTGKAAAGADSHAQNSAVTLMTASLDAINGLYRAAAERLGKLADHPVWRRAVSVWNLGRTVVTRVRTGVGRAMTDRKALGTMRMLWVRTLEVVSHAARALMRRLERTGERDGLRWNLLRAVHHAAEEGIAHAHGHLPPETRAPLGTYEAARPTPDPQAPAPAGVRAAATTTVKTDDTDARFREAALAVSESDVTLPMDLTFTLGIPAEDATALLERMEKVGIVAPPGDGGVREVLVNHETARTILDSLPAPTPRGKPQAGQEKTPPAKPTAAEGPARAESPVAATNTPAALPKRQRARASGEPSKIAAAGASRTTPGTVRAAKPTSAQDLLDSQAGRMRARADLAAKAAVTPADEKQARIWSRMADRSAQAAAALRDQKIQTPARSYEDSVTADAFIAALHVYAAARGDQIPEGLLDGAMKAAVQAAREAPRGDAGPRARSRRDGQQDEAAQAHGALARTRHSDHARRR